MRRAAGAASLGLAFAFAGATFDTASLYLPAVALVVLSVGAVLWVRLAALGAEVKRIPGPHTIEEGQPYPLRLEVKAGVLPAPGGELTDPLLDEPVRIGGMSSRRVRTDVRFQRRGRRVLEPGTLVIRDPLALAVREVTASGHDQSQELLVLPRVEPLLSADAGGAGANGSAGGLDGGGSRARLRGRLQGSAAELDLDGLRPYREGTPASRIHWPVVARSGEMIERRLSADADSAPLVVLDTSAPPSEEALDQAVRAAASLCVHLGHHGGCALLLPGDRRPAALAGDLAAWPALHVRLALVQAAGSRPPLARARRAGAVFWVSARPDAPRELARAAFGGGWLVSPGAPAAGKAEFTVAGCSGARIGRAGRGVGTPAGEGGVSAAALRGRGRFAPRAAVAGENLAEPDSPLLRLAAFTALAAFAAGHWATLVADAPTLRLAGAVAAAVAVGAALASLRYAFMPHPVVWGVALVLIPVAGAALAAMSIGLPARLLPPGAWDELANELDRGLSGIRTVDWPYSGPDDSLRLAILLGAPVMLVASATLAFWPIRRGAGITRAAGLVVLLLLYGTAVTEHDPGEPLRRGFVLLVLIAAWLWLPRLRPREAMVGSVVVLAVGLGAMPLADRLNRDTALVDYQSWNWFGGKDVVFDWNHSYGPLDWPREGTTLLNVESDRPLYWKAETLETFDGLRWVRTDQNQSTSPLAEIPREAKPEWLERVRVTVRSLRTDFVVVAGTPVDSPDGAGGSLSLSSDGTIRTLSEPLERGDSYTVNSYSPNPQPPELRAVDEPYEREFGRYTRVGLPGARDAVTEAPGAQGELLGRPPPTSVEMPLRGLPDSAARARASLATGPYARTFRLAQRLTADAPTAYAAVRNVERHLQEGFTYNERPPTHPYPLEAFLFEDKLGYCQQFSGAMALMLRMSGIPARVVSGFSPGSFNRDTGEYRVRDLDAHSWVEVFYPTVGWVVYDPTPTTSPAVTAGQGAEARDRNGSAFSPPAGGSPGAPDRSLEPGGGAGGQGSEALGAGTVAVAVLVLLLGAAGALLVLRMRRTRRLTPMERSEARLRELEQALPRLGWRLAPGATLLEVERRLRSSAGPTAAGYVAGLRDGRFSSHAVTPPDRRQRRAVRRELTAAGGLRSRLRGFLALPRADRAYAPEGRSLTCGLAQRPITTAMNEPSNSRTLPNLLAGALGGLVVLVAGAALIATDVIDTGDETRQVVSQGGTVRPAADNSGARTVGDIYEQEGRGVVSIQARGVSAESDSPFGFPQERQGTATGSGFVVDRDGTVVTNAHVVDGADEVMVRFGDDQDVDAEVLGVDPSSDLAVLKVKPGDLDLHPIELGDSSAAKVGDPVVAIGNPFGFLNKTVTTGIVSAVQRQIEAPNGFTIPNAIQTDASINPGNSGGPLLNAEGQVVGINSQIATGGGSSGSVGIGFAVPSNEVKRLLPQLKEGKEIKRPFIGIAMTPLTDRIAEQLELPVKEGVLIQDVTEGTAASRAGLRAGEPSTEGLPEGGDVITAVDGEKVAQPSDVAAAVASKAVGDEVELEVYRGDRKRTVTVKLGERPASAE